MRTKVLVIEDNEQNLYLTTFLLESAGLEVIQARDGRKGIDAAHRLTPDLILLDIQLPSMDGYAVARELRKDARLVHIHIVAVTSYAMLGDRDKAMKAGCTGYIEKPINPETFLDDIAHYLPPATRSKGAGNE